MPDRSNSPRYPSGADSKRINSPCSLMMAKHSSSKARPIGTDAIPEWATNR
ncbi:Uncharacterised protein [Vibrio cholerae]|nr:Uncharacterised protein [Vibrio cholerae]